MNIITNKKDAFKNRWNAGEKVEQEFYNLIYQHKPHLQPRFASAKENIYKRTDIVITRKCDGSHITIDVKDRKKVNSKNNSVSETHAWIELVNCENHKGWVFCKDLDLIAFKVGERKFLIVNRMDLENLAVEYTKGMPKTYFNSGKESDMSRAIYTRKKWGWDDQLVLISYETIMKYCNHKIWDFNNTPHVTH